MIKLIAITFVSTLLLSCTSTTNMSLTEKDEKYSKFIKGEGLVTVTKVTDFRFSSWKSLSNNFLIISALHNKAYLIETKRECLDLNKVLDIKIHSYSNMVFNSSSDSISPVSEFFSDKCFIKSIYPISNEQVDYMVNIRDLTSNKS